MRRYLGAFMALLLCLVVVSQVTAAVSQPQPDEGKWLTYVDPRFDFMIEYPANWHVYPRDDSRGIGAVLTFSEVDPQARDQVTKKAPLKVEIGMYLTEIEGDQSLRDWSERYTKTIWGPDLEQVRIKTATERAVDGRNVWVEEGVLPDWEYKLARVVHGKTVWFISAFCDDTHAALFDHMVRSLRFGKGAPRTLQAAYGPAFQPLPLDGYPVKVGSRSAPGLASPPQMPQMGASISWWHVPVRGFYYCTCDSSYHTGSAARAVDISCGCWTSVYAAHDGVAPVYLGYTSVRGNFVQIDRVYGSNLVWRARYNHLNAFDYVNIYHYSPAGYLYQDQCLGWSGNTGASTGCHLHFHVESNGSPIDLHGMQGLALNSGYPNSSNCGYTTW